MSNPQAPCKFTFIYGLADPSRPTFVLYVGKANNPVQRLICHMRGALLGNPHYKINKKKCNWLLRLAGKGLQPKVIILQKVLIKNWELAERTQIKIWRCKNPNLFNISSGGPYPSVNWKDNKTRIRCVKALRAGINTDSWRAHHRAAMIRRASNKILQKKIDVARKKALASTAWKRNNRKHLQNLWKLNRQPNSKFMLAIRVELSRRAKDPAWQQKMLLVNRRKEKRLKQSATLRKTNRRKKREQARNKR